MPGRSGKYLLSIRLTKSPGGGRTGIGAPPCLALTRARENEDAHDCSYENELPAHACLLFRWQTVGREDEIAVRAVVERFVCLMEDPAP